MRVFFDTSVIVYAVDRTAAHKHETAFGLVERYAGGHSMVISTQVLVETFNVLTRKRRVAVEAALATVRKLASRSVVPANAEFVLRALELSVRHQLSHWDALIVQAAMDGGCAMLLSEDLRSGMRFGNLEVVNPFAPGAHEPAPAAVPAAKAKPARVRR